MLPLAHADREAITSEIQMTAPSIPKIAEDLEQFVWAGMLGILLSSPSPLPHIVVNILIVSRGLVYEVELQILLFWMEKSDKPTSKKLPGVQKSALPKQVIAQVIVDIIKTSNTPPFTLTPVQIYGGTNYIHINMSI